MGSPFGVDRGGSGGGFVSDRGSSVWYFELERISWALSAGRESACVSVPSDAAAAAAQVHNRIHVAQ
jgi:hypothetical protein